MKKHTSTILILFFALLFVISLCFLGYEKINQFHSRQLYQDLQSSFMKPAEKKLSKDEMRLQSYAQLKQENPDMIGWLYIEDTNINYPVMQREDENEYYLRKDFYGQYSFVGTPFLDHRSHLEPATDNWMIYAHNTLDDFMFSSLLSYRDPQFYESHSLIHFDLIDQLQSFEILAVFESQVYESNQDVFKYYQFFDAANQQEFDTFVSNVKALSLYDTGIEAHFGDQLLTLSTCRYEVKDGRFVIVAKKINE